MWSFKKRFAVRRARFCNGSVRAVTIRHLSADVGYIVGV
jgi:hypothetical protein